MEYLQQQKELSKLAKLILAQPYNFYVLFIYVIKTLLPLLWSPFPKFPMIEAASLLL